MVVGGLVDESGQAFPVVLGLGVGQGHEVGKVIVLFLQVGEFFVVEHLLPGSGAVPEGDLPVGLFGQKQVADVGAHGGHAGTAADKADLTIGFPDEKIAVRPAQGHFFTGSQVEYVRRSDSGRGIGLVPGRGGDTDRELEQPLFVRRAGQGIGPVRRLRRAGFELEQVELLPGVGIPGGYLKIAERRMVFGNIDLHVCAGPVVKGVVPFKLQNQFFDECGHVFVGNHRGGIFSDVEDLLWNADFHILLNLDLTGQPDVVFLFPATDQGQFRGQNVPTTIFHHAFACPAGALAAAGAGDQNLVIQKGREQGFIAGRDNLFVGIVVNDNVPVPLDGQTCFNQQQQAHQDHNHCQKNRRAENICQNQMPIPVIM